MENRLVAPQTSDASTPQTDQTELERLRLRIIQLEQENRELKQDNTELRQ